MARYSGRSSRAPSTRSRISSRWPPLPRPCHHFGVAHALALPYAVAASEEIGQEDAAAGGDISYEQKQRVLRRGMPGCDAVRLNPLAVGACGREGWSALKFLPDPGNAAAARNLIPGDACMRVGRSSCSPVRCRNAQSRCIASLGQCSRSGAA